MENEKQTWEDTRKRYTLLIAGIDELMKNTTQLAESYKSSNMDFAQLSYANGYHQLMQKTGQLTAYERGFEFMYYSMQGHVEQLRHLKEILELLLLKDPVSIPKN